MCILMDQTLLCIGAFGLWFLFIFLFFDYVVCFSFFFLLRVLDKAEYSAFESTLNSTIVSGRVVGLTPLLRRSTSAFVLPFCRAIAQLDNAF